VTVWRRLQGTETSAKRAAAYSEDSGATWHLAEQQPGAFAVCREFSGGDFAAVGTNGTDVSHQNLGPRMDLAAYELHQLECGPVWRAAKDGRSAQRALLLASKTHWFYLIKNDVPADKPVPVPSP